jgi:sulfhydrogenase subunit alpha
MGNKIVIDDVARIEGHGGIEVSVEGKRVKGAKMTVSEGPRFFEAIIRGVRYDKVPDIMRRICGICTASHSLASIRAIERAFGIEATPQTQLLRDLLIHGEAIESHALHLFLLALPDYLGYPDAFAMAAKHAKEVEMALMLKGAGNSVHCTLSGREVHGMNERVGGFSKVPRENDLLTLRKTLADARDATELAVHLFSTVDVPDFPRSRNRLMALDPGERYGFIGDRVTISGGGGRAVEEYEGLTNERTVRHSHARHSRYRGTPFMVGALPRILLGRGKLYGESLELFREHEEKLDQGNSLNNNLAQAIELVHCVDRCVEDIDALLGSGLEREGLAEIETAACRGVGAVEAPRGILYHDYSFDGEGRIARANVITPTAMNCANIEKDLKVAAQRLLDRGEADLRGKLELVVRAYDPCISCSTHMLRIRHAGRDRGA